MRTRRGDAERERLPPVLERGVLDVHRDGAVDDVADSSRAKEVGEVAGPAAGADRPRLDLRIERLGGIPERTDRAAVGEVPNACGDDAAVPRHPRHLAEACDRVVHDVDHELGERRIEAASFERQILSRRADDLDQLLERAPGTRLVFPTATGKRWRYNQFHKLVWSKACERAAVIWRDDRGLDDDAPTPFCDLTPHDLRSTAATLMRAVGFTREEAADRLGHVDSGELLDRIYDQGDRGARAQRAIAARAPLGLRHALEAEQAARTSTRPAALAVLGAPEGTE